jgi:tripartite-type tricarboxylate transporter receptor subunit TctC
MQVLDRRLGESLRDWAKGRKNMRPIGRVMSLLVAVAACLALPPFDRIANADEALSFAGKTVTIVIGSETGGTTDSSARLMGTFLAKYLPGKPTVIVQNRPGSHSMAAMNYFAQRVKPDGLTVAVASISQLDPENYRVPQSQYDPTQFNMVGGVDLGGGILIARTDALPRIHDKTAQPLVMGAPAGLPHSTMLITAWAKEYLGWNVRWVAGYPSPTPQMILALERGEVDMTGFSITGLTDSLFDQKKYTLLYQSGTARCTRPSSLKEISHVPLFRAAMDGKISDPVAQQAFAYWCNASSTLVWMALPPETPAAVTDVYRSAFREIASDPEFLEQGKKFSVEFTTVTHESVDVAARAYGQVPPEVVSYIPKMLLRQGLKAN